MIRFDYYEPKTVEEACRLLSEFEGEVQDPGRRNRLDPKMKTGLIKPRGLVNIKKIPGLQGFTVDRRTGISMGALALISDLATHPLLLERVSSRGHSGAIASDLSR